MVRINLISPEKLADQHLVAEYNEILMLLGHVRKFPVVRNSPIGYCLGKGHINFFKNKLLYLQKRHEILKKEMERRGFKPTKSISLRNYSGGLCNDWKPRKSDFNVIKRRLNSKIRQKPGYYKYYGEKKSPVFFIDLLK